MSILIKDAIIEWCVKSSTVLTHDAILDLANHIESQTCTIFNMELLPDNDQIDILNSIEQEATTGVYWLEPVVAAYTKPIINLNDLPFSDTMNGIKLNHGDRVLVTNYGCKPMIIQYMYIDRPHWNIVQTVFEIGSKLMVLDKPGKDGEIWEYDV